MKKNASKKKAQAKGSRAPIIETIRGYDTDLKPNSMGYYGKTLILFHSSGVFNDDVKNIKKITLLESLEWIEKMSMADQAADGGFLHDSCYEAEIRWFRQLQDELKSIHAKYDGWDKATRILTDRILDSAKRIMRLESTLAKMKERNRKKS